LEIRRKAWWSVLSGARLGHFFGNCPIWGFDNVRGYCSAPSGGWSGQLNSTLSNHLSYVGRLFGSRAFYLLRPDATNSVMTAGTQSNETKATTSRAVDGRLVVAYIPTRRTVTINLMQVSGASAKAWWFNPRTAEATLIGTYATTSAMFTPPDQNDWVLVIDDASLNLAPPGGGTSTLPAPSAPTNVRIIR
jgi:hypothetical protein